MKNVTVQKGIALFILWNFEESLLGDIVYDRDDPPTGPELLNRHVTQNLPGRESRDEVPVPVSLDDPMRNAYAHLWEQCRAAGWV